MDRNVHINSTVYEVHLYEEVKEQWLSQNLGTPHFSCAKMQGMVGCVRRLEPNLTKIIMAPTYSQGFYNCGIWDRVCRSFTRLHARDY